ncbi:hypothetical protein V5F34_16770 [Xanthobacter autotrophicus]|uniref:DUF2946 domain-containing protein n=1 Tax=Xanthobacter autotrophicus TaxID=280 RepID=A0A6C1KL55_XANAU|nr:hypothetical protein [Xanthobacter autotrophicus]TLX44895.1 hypothetical protein FBQ73_00225 [Xanthobacter autotrophicus]
MLITGSAFRRAVSVVVMACLVAGPFAGALAAHHIFDVDGALEELAGTSVALTGVDVSSLDLSPVDASSSDPSLAAADAKVFGAAHDPAQPQPSADHDCHACAMALPDAPAASAVLRLRSTPVVLPTRLNAGRSVPADIRPPRA